MGWKEDLKYYMKHYSGDWANPEAALHNEGLKKRHSPVMVDQERRHTLHIKIGKIPPLTRTKEM